MRHRRDALLLQKGGLAHQCPGGDEQHPAAAAAQQFWQDMPTEHGGAAARARAAAFHPLLLGIVEQTAAVRVVFQQQTLCCQQFPQHLTAHQPKVAGVDAVKIPQFCMGIGKIVQQGGSCCRCHGCAHVVDILDVIILHPACVFLRCHLHLPAPPFADSLPGAAGAYPFFVKEGRFHAFFPSP